ncbi:hypothetical protein F8388_008458 [Cannabis sativa]|uniref:Uncharacterized protein n=1 Tax=Cannabis sativa TaxID=3483 RepID=A0A7J6DTT5_CANSA|nr:hypothetical protein F8388_008458 [Cannabis sativa]
MSLININSGKDEEEHDYYYSSSLVVPLLQPKTLSNSSSSHHLDSNHHQIKTGNIWSCVAHIITGVIGAGVLSLSWSVAQLGKKWEYVSGFFVILSLCGSGIAYTITSATSLSLG